MTWLDGFSDLKVARERAQRAFYAPLGMMSPLWIAFGAAASAGAAYWWVSRLAKPLNLEALMAPGSAAIVAAAPPALGGHAPQVEAAAGLTILETMIEPVVEGLTEVETVIADDLTKLSGVGPKIAQALSERGVDSFQQLAAWTQQDLADFDAALDLRGRAVRADFVAQARRLASGEA